MKYDKVKKEVSFDEEDAKLLFKFHEMLKLANDLRKLTMRHATLRDAAYAQVSEFLVMEENVPSDAWDKLSFEEEKNVVLLEESKGGNSMEIFRKLFS
jgi:hypothetical protein